MRSAELTRGERTRRTFGKVILTGSLAVLSACGGGHSLTSKETITKPTAPSTVPGVNPEPGPSVLLKGSNHIEIEQFGTSTFTDYTHAYGVGPKLAVGTKVIVDCIAIGPVAAAPSTNGKWYHIEGPEPYSPDPHSLF